MTEKAKINVKLHAYTLGEELFNAISHGIGAALSIAALVLLVLKAEGALAETCAALFGAAMIILYTMSCVYHALSPALEGKKVLRVLDHCSVYLLVLGTYIPASLLGVGGTLGWVLFGVICFFTVLGITLSAVNVDRFQVLEVICHLINGWSILIGIPALLRTAGTGGVFYLILGGVMYTLGAVLYAIGARKRYMHSVFHVFCMLGTFCHFWSIYNYIL